MDSSRRKTKLGTLDGSVMLKSKSSAAAASGTFFRDGQTLSFDVLLGLPKTANIARLPFRASLTGPLLKAEINGELVRDKALHIVASKSDISAPDLKAVAEWLGAGSIASAGFGAFSAKGPCEWDGRTLTLQPAEFAIDGNAASGSLSVALGGKRPALEGTLDFASLDLTPYVSGGSKRDLADHSGVAAHDRVRSCFDDRGRRCGSAHFGGQG